MNNPLLYKDFINTRSLFLANRYLLYLYAFVLVFERILPIIQGLSLPKAAILIYGASLMLNPKFYRESYKVPPEFLALLALFLLLNILNGGLFFTERFRSLDQALFFNILSVWLIYSHNKIDPFVIRKSLYFFTLGISVVVIMSSLGIYDIEPQSGRLSINGSLPNSLGFNCVYGILFFVMIYETYKARSMQTNPNERLFLPIALLFMFAAFYILILTGSRSAFLALIGALFIFTLVKYKVSYAMFLFLIAAFIIFTIGAGGVLILRLTDSVVTAEFGGRLALIFFSLEVIQEHYLFGVGRAGYDELAELTFGRSPSPHNVFLETILYGGVPAGITLIYIMFRMVKLTIREYKFTGNIVPFILMVPIFVQALSQQLFNSKIAFLIIAFTLSLNNDYFNGKDKNKNTFINY